MKPFVHIVGARPNFMKMAPVFSALNGRGAQQIIIHTGQHYSANMSDIFFTELGIPQPDINLHIGSGSQAGQVADIMKALEPVLQERQPALVIVYGDVNSTMAAAIVCAKLGIPTAHVEAGLRSGDLNMPEEINRIVTDRLASWYFTPSPDAGNHLKKEGVDSSCIYLVGNVMIDTLVKFLPIIEKTIVQTPADRFGVITLHRPSNVDDPERLHLVIGEINRIAEHIPLVFPVHPRTAERIKTSGITLHPHITIQEPLGYVEFLALVKKSAFIITDSGGIQEETTYLGIPCLTLRNNTERPITITEGTNTLIGEDFSLLQSCVDSILGGTYKKGAIPQLWDGKSATRVADILLS